MHSLEDPLIRQLGLLALFTSKGKYTEKHTLQIVIHRLLQTHFDLTFREPRMINNVSRYFSTHTASFHVKVQVLTELLLVLQTTWKSQ